MYIANTIKSDFTSFNADRIDTQARRHLYYCYIEGERKLFYALANLTRRDVMDRGYKYTKLGQLKLYNRIVRSSFSLPDAERSVLLFILDRTVGWQKAAETISNKEFERGVYRRKGGQSRLVTQGTGLSPEQINRAVAALCELRAIEVDHIASKSIYGIEAKWCHPELEIKGMSKIWSVGEGDFIYKNE